MFNHSFALYLITVLIWGSTWFAVKLQLGEVAPEVSVAYRFAFAAALLIGYCLLRKLKLRFSRREHAYMALLGLCLFSSNYMLIYQASVGLTSGLIAVLFSSVILLNIINGRIFFKQAVAANVLIGAILGLVGISLVFWPEMQHLLDDHSGRYIGLAMIATYLASLGNLVSARNSKHGLPIVQANAFGMGYGALFTILWAVITGTSFSYSTTWGYSLSLLYLSVFGSIIAFGTYLTLVSRIGASKAAYATILFPVVALSISTLFENYTWSLAAGLGMALVIAGNLIAISGQNQRSKLLSTFNIRPKHQT